MTKLAQIDTLLQRFGTFAKSVAKFWLLQMVCENFFFINVPIVHVKYCIGCLIRNFHFQKKVLFLRKV
jgi:hypothetical protein